MTATTTRPGRPSWSTTAPSRTATTFVEAGGQGPDAGTAVIAKHRHSSSRTIRWGGLRWPDRPGRSRGRGVVTLPGRGRTHTPRTVLQPAGYVVEERLGC